MRSSGGSSLLVSDSDLSSGKLRRRCPFHRGGTEAEASMTLLGSQLTGGRAGRGLCTGTEPASETARKAPLVLLGLPGRVTPPLHTSTVKTPGRTLARVRRSALPGFLLNLQGGKVSTHRPNIKVLKGRTLQPFPKKVPPHRGLRLEDGERDGPG